MGKLKPWIFALHVCGKDWCMVKPMMGKYYRKENKLRGESKRNNDVYVPKWAQTLIDLYTSPLKYEVMYKMRGEAF